MPSISEEQLIQIPRTRGRPRGGDKQQVIQGLLDATEQLLRDVGPAELTERKIAAAAGVHERMIHYYFGDKDGLLFDLVARRCDEAIDCIESIDAQTLRAEDATYRIIKTIVEAYYDKPWIAK